jgi:thioredoxin reductase
LLSCEHQRAKAEPEQAAGLNVYEFLIAGAGRAGISASLRAAGKKLNHLALEQSDIGGAVAKYPPSA